MKAKIKFNTCVQKIIFCIVLILTMTFICSCEVGPNYIRPKVLAPANFKEAPKGWVIAKPQDTFDRGCWWKTFHDPQLNSLEAQLNVSNQTIAQDEANYREARALVCEARAAFFPTITASASVIREKSSSNISQSSGSSSTSTSSGSSSSSSAGGAITTSSLLLNGTWEPDIWGAVRRSVEAASANAQASAAILAGARLSEQSLLAEDYFELRALDTDQKILNDTVVADQKIVKYTQDRFKYGVAAMTDVAAALTEQQTAQAQAINNGIARAEYEHAIAVLIGQPPETFSLPMQPLTATPPFIPVSVPSVLLERRPDIAQAEREMAQDNALIGVAIAGYFPNLLLTASADSEAIGMSHLFSVPAIGWSLGAQLAETIFNGGLTGAQVAAARANYDSTIANYKQVVLAAFQNVEDNLASLRILNEQSVVQNEAAANADLSLRLVLNQYKSGTADYDAVLLAQIIALSDEKTAADVNGLRMSSAVGLIEALGGGWNAAYLNNS